MINGATTFRLYCRGAEKFILHTTNCALYTENCVEYTLCTVHCVEYTVHYALYTLQGPPLRNSIGSIAGDIVELGA